MSAEATSSISSPVSSERLGLKSPHPSVHPPTRARPSFLQQQW